MFNFRDKMTPEQKAKWDWFRAQVEEHRAMTQEELLKWACYIYLNCQPRWQKTDNVYDAILHWVIVPELIKRLLGRDSITDEDVYRIGRDFKEELKARPR